MGRRNQEQAGRKEVDPYPRAREWMCAFRLFRALPCPCEGSSGSHEAAECARNAL